MTRHFDQSHAASIIQGKISTRNQKHVCGEVGIPAKITTETKENLYLVG
jgi:hypothetical protein